MTRRIDLRQQFDTAVAHELDTLQPTSRTPLDEAAD